MDAVETVDGVAALAGHTLVAGRTIVVVEVGATRALQEVAAHSRHVADLRGGAGEDGAGEDWVLRADDGVFGHGCVAGRCADAKAAFRRGIDRVGKRGNVNEGRRPLQSFAHQVDEVGAATEVLGAFHAAQLKGEGAVGGARKGELVHCASA